MVSDALFKNLAIFSHGNIFQKHGGLGSRGEEALAKALDKNNQLLKISYPFKVPSSRSLADRCQIRNNEICK